jgi:hypothetical protein
MPGKEVTVFFGSKPKTSLREKLYPCSVRRKGVLPERKISHRRLIQCGPVKMDTK